MQSYLLVDPTSQLIQLLPLDCLLDPRFFNMYITFVKSVKMNVLICEWSKSVTCIVHGQRHNLLFTYSTFIHFSALPS
jgi:hypothetical protein